MHLLFIVHLFNIFIFFMAVGLGHFIHPKCLIGDLFMYSENPAVVIPSCTNFVRYDCSHIEHVHPIFCARLIFFGEC